MENYDVKRRDNPRILLFLWLNLILTALLLLGLARQQFLKKDTYEDMERRQPDCTKINKLLGWKPKKSLHNILESVAKFERSRLQ